jgi:hypothetical protein
MITNSARCTREIKSRIAMEKAEFTSKLDFNFKKKLVKCYISINGAGTWDTSESRSETPGKI